LKPTLEERTIPLEEVQRLDRELARLGRGEAPTRLRLGDLFDALGRTGGHRALGMHSMALYSLERCERSGRWAAESRAMARRLVKLPRIRAALASGAISWSMAEVISRRATADTEEAILEDAKASTVRVMRARLPAKASDPDPEEDPPMRTLTVTMSAAEAWALECTRQLAEAIDGNRSDESVVYALLAEGETALVEVTKRSLDLDSTSARDEAKRAAEYRAQMSAWRREAEEMTEDSLDLEVEAPEPIPDAPIPRQAVAGRLGCAREEDDRLRARRSRRAGRDAGDGRRVDRPCPGANHALPCARRWRPSR
jgi:hypothetical protein